MFLALCMCETSLLLVLSITQKVLRISAKLIVLFSYFINFLFAKVEQIFNISSINPVNYC